MVAPLGPELLLAPPTPLTGRRPQKLLSVPVPSLELALTLPATLEWVLPGPTLLHCSL